MSNENYNFKGKFTLNQLLALFLLSRHRVPFSSVKRKDWNVTIILISVFVRLALVAG